MLSLIHVSAACVLQAALQGCTIVEDPNSRSGGLCYLQPVSSCLGVSVKSATRLNSYSGHTLLRMFDEVAARFNLASDLLVTSTVMAWYLRP